MILNNIISTYKHFSTSLLGYCQKFLHNYNFSEDVVQDIWISLLEKENTGESFISPRQTAKWLYTVAKNKCLNEIRRNKYRQTEELDYANNLFPTNENIEDDFDKKEQFNSILSSFNDRDQLIVCYYFVLGMTEKECAQKCNCSEPTARRTIKKFLNFENKCL